MSFDNTLKSYAQIDKKLAIALIDAEMKDKDVFGGVDIDIRDSTILEVYPSFDWPFRFLAERKGATADFIELYNKKRNVNIWKECFPTCLQNDTIDLKYLMSQLEKQTINSKCRKLWFSCIIRRSTLTPEEYEMVVDQYKLSKRYPLSETMMNLTPDFVRRQMIEYKKVDKKMRLDIQVQYLDMEEIVVEPLASEFCIREVASWTRHIDFVLNYLEEGIRQGIHKTELYLNVFTGLCQNPGLTIEHIIERPHFPWFYHFDILVQEHKHMFPDILYLFDWAPKIVPLIAQEYKKVPLVHEINSVQLSHMIIFAYDTTQLFDENFVRVLYK